MVAPYVPTLCPGPLDRLYLAFISSNGHSAVPDYPYRDNASRLTLTRCYPRINGVWGRLRLRWWLRRDLSKWRTMGSLDQWTEVHLGCHQKQILAFLLLVIKAVVRECGQARVYVRMCESLRNDVEVLAWIESIRAETGLNLDHFCFGPESRREVEGV